MTLSQVSDHIPITITLQNVPALVENANVIEKCHTASEDMHKIMWIDHPSANFSEVLSDHLSAANTCPDTPQKLYDRIKTSILGVSKELNMLIPVWQNAQEKKSPAPWFDQSCHDLKQETYRALLKCNDNHCWHWNDCPLLFIKARWRGNYWI